MKLTIRKHKYAKLLLRPLMVLVMFFTFLLPCYAMEDTGETYAVGFKQGERKTNFYECDATEEYIFFSYEEGNLVDAYNYDGKFQFTLFFEDYTNGGFRIECHNNQLYVQTKKDAVFIFDGSSLVQEMYYSSAADLGFHETWFSNRGNIQVSKTNVYRVSEDGQKTAIAKTPKVIVENLPLLLISPEVDRVITITGIAVFALFVTTTIVVHIVKSMKEAKNKPFRLH